MAAPFDGSSSDDEQPGASGAGAAGLEAGAEGIGIKTFDLGSLPPGNLQMGGELGRGILKHDDTPGKARVVSARGTEDGFVLRIDGKADWEAILAELEVMLGGRQRFFEGGEVLIEWLDRLPTKEQSKDLGEVLKSRYGIGVTSRRKRILHSMAGNSASGEGEVSPRTKRAGSTIPLFDGSQLEEAGQATVGLGRESGRAIELSNEVPAEREGSRRSVDRHLPDRKMADRNVLNQRTGECEDEFPGLSGFVAGERFSAAGQDDLNYDRAGYERAAFERAGSEWAAGERMRADGVGIDSLRGLEPNDLSSRYLSKVARILGNDILTDDEANAKVLFGTLRSGQRIETPFSLIVIGDVNPGADIIAGGDIAVLGSLRGTAHAAAYDDDSFDRVIIALHMQPMQLRIGSVISRGSDEASSGPEIARIENRRIVVEPYNARGVGAKKRSAGW